APERRGPDAGGVHRARDQRDPPPGERAPGKVRGLLSRMPAATPVSTASVETGWGSLVSELATTRGNDLAAGSMGTARLRVGDVALEVGADTPAILEELDTHYGDCGIAGLADAAADIRCVATRVPGSPLLRLAFDGAGLPDILEPARGAYRLVRYRRYVE